MQLGEVPNTGFEWNTPEVIAVGANVLAVAAVIGITYLGVKAVVTGRNPLSAAR